MFNLFNKSDECPVEEVRREWIDSCFRWLVGSFGIDSIRTRKILRPVAEDFAIDFIGNEDNAFELLDIIAVQMDLDPQDIDIDFYAEGEKELVTGAGSYSRVFLRPAEHETTTAGHYRGKDESGCYIIGLNSRTMKNVESLIATIAHELAHIKLLGEERLKKNNESLTDLTTVIFGLGIFGANSAAKFEKGTFSWSHGKLGYLSEMDWGYALALTSFIRSDETTEWKKYLSPNVRHDFEQSQRFIIKNPDKILRKKSDREGTND